MPKNKVNWPVFVYNDSHLSLRHPYKLIVVKRLSQNDEYIRK